TRAFTEALDGRDVFLGQKRCVVCRAGQTEYCYILPDTDSTTWAEAKAHGWVPAHAAELPEHPSNGLLLCATHKAELQSKSFFIRYLPEHQKLIFLNLSAAPALQPFHAKAIALDIDEHNSTLPTLFLLHELRARAAYPFQSVPYPPQPSPGDIAWQDWITSSGVLRSSDSSPYFYR
ncbi:hypothetical protein EV122DRAFT_193271, partial [Schizophyllum commune]